MWREIGLSLDRSGLLVKDQNRDIARYKISTSILEGKEKINEIKLTDRNDKYIVTAHKVDKLEKISYDDARTILKHIVSAYGSSIAKN